MFCFADAQVAVTRPVRSLDPADVARLDRCELGPHRCGVPDQRQSPKEIHLVVSPPPPPPGRLCELKPCLGHGSMQCLVLCRLTCSCTSSGTRGCAGVSRLRHAHQLSACH